MTSMFPLARTWTLCLTFLVGGVSQAADNDIAKLSWLAGCWKSESSDISSTEQWMSPAGGIMIGMSRTVKQGRAIEFEFMQIRTTDAGSLEFIAKPSGQDEATFTLLRLSDTEAVFENLQHDFPQRIIYRFVAGQLRARIEGMRNGSLRAIEYPMLRSNCGPGQRIGG